MSLPISVGRTARTSAILCLTSLLVACGGGGGGGGGGNSGGGGGGTSNTPPSFSSATDFTFAENTEVRFTLTVQDPDSATVTITDDSTGDGALFTVDAGSGVVTANTGNGAFNFEDPQDVNTDNVYEQNITLSDGTNTVSETITVTITDVDEPPEFAAVAPVMLNENATGVIATFAATDPEGGTVSDYRLFEVSKLGEVVNAQRLLDAFSVDAVTGELSVVIPFDAEVEGTQDNISVSIAATDGTQEGVGGVTIQLIDLPARVASGVRYTGRDTVTRLGAAISQVGDIDQDGISDFWIAEQTDEAGLEVAYLVWGSTVRDEMLDGSGDLSIQDLTAGQFVRITNDARDQTERRSILEAIAAGDIDGDSVPDLLVLPVEQRDFAFDDVADGPLAYILWGDRLQGPAGDEIALAALAAVDGIAITGPSRFENIRLNAAADDIDGDGRFDLLFGAPQKGLARMIMGSALTKGDAAFDVTAATASEALVIQSMTDMNVIQQIGSSVDFLADVSGDGRPEAVVAGQGLEPNLFDGIYIIASEVVTNAIGVASDLNVLDPAVADQVIEMTIADAAVTSVVANGDVDNDGLDDLAIAHVGNGGNELIATLVYGATINDAFTNNLDPSLTFASPSEGLNILLSGQIDSQTIGANVVAMMLPSIGGGGGDELLIGLDESTVLGRRNAGSLWLLTDDALTSQVSATVDAPFDSFPATLGRQLPGPVSDGRLGGLLFVADLDDDSVPDISLASISAGLDSSGISRGAYYFLPGSELVSALAAADAIFDLAIALANESP